MSINLINIINNKYLQAKRALQEYSLSFRDSLGEGNRTRKKIRKFNTLNAILSYYENTIKPSTYVKGAAPSAIILKNLKIQSIFGGVHPLNMTDQDVGTLYGPNIGLSYAYLFGITPLNLYTTDVYGNIVNIVNLTYGWPANIEYNNFGINSLADEFSGSHGAPAPTAISQSALGLSNISVIAYYAFSNSEEDLNKYYRLVEKCKSNIVASINNTSKIFGAEILNGDVVIKVINKEFYGAFNLQKVYANPFSVSWDNVVSFAGGVSEVPETASYSSQQTKEILNRLDVVASELGITYTDSEPLNLNIDNATNEIIDSIPSDIISYAEGSLHTEDGEPIAAESSTVVQNNSSEASSTSQADVSASETSSTSPQEGGRSYTSNTTTRSSSGSSGGGY